MAAMLRPSVSRLLQHTLTHTAPVTSRQAARSTSYSARFFATTSRRAKVPSSPHHVAASPFAALRQRFASSLSRGVATGPYVAPGQGSTGVDWTRIGTTAGLALVGTVAINYFLNRDTRDSLSPFEKSYLNDSFKWTGGGLLITASVAKLLHSNGFAVRMMSANPWLVMGVGVAAGIGSMMGVFYTKPDSPLVSACSRPCPHSAGPDVLLDRSQHYASFALFSAVQGATLAPMFFLNPAILSRAGLYTLGAVSGLTWVGATAKSDTFLYIGGPLLAGLGVLVVSSLAPMLLPRMSMRAMSALEHVTAYGGVVLFSMFILYDTQKILAHAQLAQRGAIPRDPVRESVSLILDVINLFVRIVQVLMLQQRRK
ncbi:BQ2448_5736 [Microbotryum intermedium]|uniref:BQ2448_5736 protein n=1 Tax=Microbotryum intermedium TaxID=269621 RepID=A0A238EZ28_9BASI|nr:BQ2448_5736 [Microbotryum intermedium]